MNHATRTRSIIARTGLVLATTAAIVIPIAGVANAANSGTTTPTVPASTPTKGFDLAAAKARAAADIDKRLSTVSGLEAKVARVEFPDGCRQFGNADLNQQLHEDSSGLTSLAAQIAALPDGTTRAQFEPLDKQIFETFRIYALQTPKTAVVIACDKTLIAADQLDKVVAEIKKTHPDLDVSGILDDIKAAKDAAHQAAQRVVPLAPDQGNTGVANANKAALAQSRQDLLSARTSLLAARDAIKALKL